MENKCIFCEIVKGNIPKEFEYEDDLVVAFKDIHPVAPVHILIVPKKHIEEFYTLSDVSVLRAVHTAAKRLIENNDLTARGYRIEANGGGAQLVNHLHFHLVGPVRKPTV